jgi:hypothetical protein
VTPIENPVDYGEYGDRKMARMTAEAISGINLREQVFHKDAKRLG